MKRTITAALFILAISYLPAAERTCFSFSYGRFTPADPRYERVYTSGREIYSFEVTQPVLRSDRHFLGLTGGLRRFVKKGRSTLTGDEARLTLLPFSIGVRYILDLEFLRPWAQLGLDRVGYEEVSPLQTNAGSSLGYHIQGGLWARVPGIEPLSLQVLIRHSRAVAEENGISANLGGLEFGIGLTIAVQLF